jgi:hypothetical protein
MMYRVWITFLVISISALADTCNYTATDENFDKSSGNAFNIVMGACLKVHDKKEVICGKCHKRNKMD